MSDILRDPPLEILRRNNPADVSLYILVDDMNEQFAEDIAEALDDNDHVTDIYLICWATTTPIGRWHSLLRVISSRRKTEMVSIRDQENVFDRERLAAFFQPVLDAVKLNPSIDKVSLSASLPGSSISSFLDGAPSVVGLSLHTFDVVASDIPIIAAALKRNTNVRVLQVFCCSSTLSLINCLASENIRSINGLLLGMGNTFDDQTNGANAALLPQVLQACARWRVDHLKISQAQTSAQIRQIIRAIPSFKVSHFTLKVDNGNVLAQAKQGFLTAVNRNFRLHSLTWIEADGTDAFLSSDKRQLELCMLRNRRLSNWVANPTSLPKHLWPKALMLAREAGYDDLFLSLQLVAPEYAKRKRSRKRKRPTYFDPCPQARGKPKRK